MTVSPSAILSSEVSTSEGGERLLCWDDEPTFTMVLYVQFEERKVLLGSCLMLVRV